jgi:lysophospholipase L1-like esterase
VDGLDLFGPGDEKDLPDGLHASPAGYARIAERFLAMMTAEGGPFTSL